MNDKSAGQDAGTNQSQRRCQIQKVFMRDLSFEVPRGYAAFDEIHAPKMQARMSLSYATWPDDQYEVILHMHMHVVSRELVTLCLIELEQGGMFHIRGYTDDEIVEVIRTECAAALYPFGREVIWSILGKGGFHTALMGPLDLQSLLHLVKEVNAEKEDAGTGQASA